MNVGKRNEADSLFSETYSKVRTYVRSLCGNASDADDITQDTLVRAFVYLDTFDNRASFETWILTIARNQYFDSLRRAKRRVQSVSSSTSAIDTLVDQMADQGPNPEEELVQSHLDFDLQEAILELPEADRTLLHWIAVEQMPFVDAAERLDAKPRQLMTRYRRITKEIRHTVRRRKQARKLTQLHSGVVTS